MYYSLVGFLALCILIIANHDILLKRIDRTGPRVQRVYFRFLLSIIAYYVTDILWGILDALSLTAVLYVDTVIYYVAMAAGILFWTQYVLAYLEERNTFSAILRYVGMAFFAVMCLLLLTNFFTPIVFCFDENGAYQAGPMRHTMLVIQVLMFLLTSIYALRVTRKTRDSVENRHLTIGLFGLIMAILLSVQLFFPLLPLYSIGYMLGSSLLRTFVIENEKDTYQRDLEAALRREQRQLKELSTARELAYTDALTGVKSKLAYSEKEMQIDKSISDGSMGGVSVVVFDLNNLKRINDTMGHGVGDRYIIDASALIGEVFRNSPVFRIGGDEFAVILEGADHENRETLMDEFHRRVEENRKAGKALVAAGMAEYLPGIDFSFERVFKRADRQMYLRKEELKRLVSVRA